MVRSILAVIAGFVLWTVLWLSCNAGLQKAGLLPAEVTQPLGDPKALLLLLIGSCVISAISGFATAAIARAGAKTAVTALGVLLLAVGIFVQSQVWNLMPLWYHIPFLLLLIPLCFVGASLRRS